MVLEQINSKNERNNYFIIFIYTVYNTISNFHETELDLILQFPDYHKLRKLKIMSF